MAGGYGVAILQASPFLADFIFRLAKFFYM